MSTTDETLFGHAGSYAPTLAQVLEELRALRTELTARLDGLENSLAQRVARELVIHEEKIIGFVGERLDAINERIDSSAEDTRENSKDLADGVMEQMAHTEALVSALAEGHERMGAAHGHTSIRIRSIVNGGSQHAFRRGEGGP